MTSTTSNNTYLHLFTTPTLAKVERIWTPAHDDIAENPWIPTTLWHGEDDNSHLTV